MDALPASVVVNEVSPRDGLQSVNKILSSAHKIQLINELSACGFQSIETGSFVNPQAIPQLADAEAVFAQIAYAPGCEYSAVLANDKGMLRAQQCGVKIIALLTAASETFCQNNTNCSLAESLQRVDTLVRKART